MTDKTPGSYNWLNLKDYPILYVDDEEPNRIVFEAAFSTQFTVLCADSGESALELLERREVAILMADHRMPGMSGVDLCERIQNERPEILRILITAYSDQRTAIDAINRGGVIRYMAKPWNLDEVRQVLREAAARYHLERTVKRLRAAMLDRDRLAALAAARAGMLHDLGNVGMMVASACVGLEAQLRKMEQAAGEHRGGLGLEGLRGKVGDMRTAVNYLTQLTTRANNEAMRQQPERSLHRAGEIVEAVTALTRADFRGGIQLVGSSPEDLTVWADRTDVSRILVNLVTNACPAIQSASSDGRVEGGRVEIKALREGEDAALFLVSDNGPGISAAVRERVFEAFYSENPNGHGLGLSICRELAALNGGTIELVSSADEGATFLLTLPARKPA